MRIFPWKLLFNFRIRFPRLSGLFLSADRPQLPRGFAYPQAGIISQKHRLIYIPIAKVACSSIKKSLFPLFDLDSNLDPHDAPLPIIPNRKIIDLNDYFTFAFVRNPWDRLVSCYRDKIQPYTTSHQTMTNRVFKGFLDKYGNRFYAGMTFADFALRRKRSKL